MEHHPSERPGEINIMVAGAAGQGMQTIGAVLGKFFVRQGNQVFAVQDNQSRIRGGHNTFQLRAADHPVRAVSMPLEVLIALNQESVDRHIGEVASWGVIVHDSDKTRVPDEGPAGLGLPLETLAVEAGGNRIYANSVALGAVLALLDWDVAGMEAFLEEYYAAKAGMAAANARAARLGYERARDQAGRYGGPRIRPRNAKPRMFVSGHEAVALGALAAGCRFMSAYPMSPSTSIISFLAEQAEDFGLVAEQAEDEIAAVNMAIGAAWAGVRSLTATSGGGFSLMVEGLGLAGITETPLVIVEAQRPGPSTGIATKTEQPDLLFVLHASQDEFPRIILAPGTAREAFEAAIRAFDLADQYQTPVIILTDQFLADSYFTEERFDVSALWIDRHLITSEEAEALREYKRYRITDSGISPRALPSSYGFTVGADSHEHDEYAHISENIENRVAMMDKRFRKMEGAAREQAPPTVFGPETADLCLVGWGSTYGALEEAVEMLNREGHSVMGLHLGVLWPFPGDHLARILAGAKRWAVVEANYSGQLARLIRTELMRQPEAAILKYTGRPFTGIEIADRVRKGVLER
ncbi:MAG: 2-oxoacid:acceptor oxidoreductase subunit alpha [Proteobacteria bacterium]|nr:2-oxoacid:acceptor oxidoreductase subunit alpha [Pseudomonadota bacterium]